MSTPDRRPGEGVRCPATGIVSPVTLTTVKPYPHEMVARPLIVWHEPGPPPPTGRYTLRFCPMAAETKNSRALHDLLRPAVGYDPLAQAVHEVIGEDEAVLRKKEDYKELLRRAKRLEADRQDHLKRAAEHDGLAQGHRRHAEEERKSAEVSDRLLGETLAQIQNMAAGRPPDDGADKKGGATEPPPAV